MQVLIITSDESDDEVFHIKNGTNIFDNHAACGMHKEDLVLCNKTDEILISCEDAEILVEGENAEKYVMRRLADRVVLELPDDMRPPKKERTVVPELSPEELQDIADQEAKEAADAKDASDKAEAEALAAKEKSDKEAAEADAAAKEAEEAKEDE